MVLSLKSLLFFAISLSITAHSTLAAADEYCFEEAGTMYHVSPDLLRAISEVESDHNPFAINYNENGTYDFSHMGINSSWAHVLGMDLWMSIDNPCQASKVGAWVLAQCVQRHGYTWEAIGCYNAKSRHNRIKYAWKIYSALQKTRKDS
jgi:soluble lytic murein transglycosylase-like protein